MVGTDENQTAVAPGTLRRMWTENNRRYFEYGVDAPIRNDYLRFVERPGSGIGMHSDATTIDYSEGSYPL